MAALEELPVLRIALGGGAGDLAHPGLPLLGGAAQENLFPAMRRAGSAGVFALFAEPGWLLGAASVPLDEGLEAVTHRLYADLLTAKGALHLARIWNYVPGINIVEPGSLENYRLFCRGRSQAFEEQLGQGFKAHLPAASAVGSLGRELTVIFAACEALPRHVENPLQMPAYDYPVAYGPRPPSFARATIVAGPATETVFISGTAAIRGHVTISPHATPEQLDCTLQNLQVISRACGLGEDFAAGDATERHFKIYLRQRDDYAFVAREVERRLVRAGDHVAYVEADICRRDLNVEIEATVFRTNR